MGRQRDRQRNFSQKENYADLDAW